MKERTFSCLHQVALIVSILLVNCGSGQLWGSSQPTELARAGFSVIPTPSEVFLNGQEVVLDSQWVIDPGTLDDSDISVRTLVADMAEFNGLLLGLGDRARKVIQLHIQPGTVLTSCGSEIDDQAYQLSIESTRVTIAGNTRVGLFYGVQTLVQMTKTSRTGEVLLPSGVIRDWPWAQLRFLHWDTKHHQDRIETLKRYLDWSARFKINMIGFELEDKFSYPSHPVIAAPGAFTPEQLQDIVNYGLERHIQVVPQIQSPAHMAYVLKHQEFAHLRSDGNNFQSCLCDEEAHKLIFEMFQDVIDATKGVNYFFVSTDEVYFAGICEKCKLPFNEENRSLAWVEFVNRAHKFLQPHNRRMLIWLEFPLLPEHVSKLPKDVINAIGPAYGWFEERQGYQVRLDYLAAQAAAGIDHLNYNSIQGGDYLFPDSFGSARSQGILQRLYDKVLAEAEDPPLGIFGAAWDDAGLHNETFWLGWATTAQYGWTAGIPTLSQHVSEFMNAYYGPDVVGMVDVYKSLGEQGRFFKRSWDRVAGALGPGYGGPRGKGVPDSTGFRRKHTLPRPALPSLPGLAFSPAYEGRYNDLVEEAAQMLEKTRKSEHRLQENMFRATRNRYNLEVLLAIALFGRHHSEMILAMKTIEDQLSAASAASGTYQPKRALLAMVDAYEVANTIVRDRTATFLSLKSTYERSRYPKGRSVDGQEFLQVPDDVKAHWADRRSDLSFMTMPEENIGLESWRDQMRELILEYAAINGLSSDQLVRQLEP